MKRSQIINQLKKENEELKKMVISLKVQQGVDKIILGLHEKNFASAAADYLINPNPIKIHATEKGAGYDVLLGVRNILAIKSEGRTKKIHLKHGVTPANGGTAKWRIETNDSFDHLLAHLGQNCHHLLRISDSHVINIYEYELLKSGTFVLTSEPPKQFDKALREIKVDKKFSHKVYHTRLMEIDRLFKHHQDFSINLRKIEEISRYKNQ